MKKQLRTLSVISLIFSGILSSCNNGGQNTPTSTNGTDSIADSSAVIETSPAESNVNWEKPLYTIAGNDTTFKWEYNEKGQKVKDYEMENGAVITTNTYEYDANGNLVNNEIAGYFQAENTFKYDDQNRRIKCEGNMMSGNTHWYNSTYSYDGQKKTENSFQSTEGDPEAQEAKTITYYMDKEFQYDTLSQTYERTVSLGAEEESESNDNEDNFGDKYQSYQTKKYQVINGKTLPTEKVSYRINEAGDSYDLTYKFTYQYDEMGRVIKTQSITSYGTTETLYSYEGNCQTKTTKNEDNDRVERIYYEIAQ